MVTPVGIHYEKAASKATLCGLFIDYADSASNQLSPKRLYKLMLVDPELAPIQKDILTSFVRRNTPYHAFKPEESGPPSIPQPTFTGIRSYFKCKSVKTFTSDKKKELRASDYIGHCKIAHNAVLAALAAIGPQTYTARVSDASVFND